MDTGRLIDCVYESLEGNLDAKEYNDRHGIRSAHILTITSPTKAELHAAQLTDRIVGKTVIEVGAGVGYLAMAMAKYAHKVFAIEADPAWSWVYMTGLYRQKPANLTWIFGAAEEMVGILHGDVAVVVTRSGIASMQAVAGRLANEVITILREVKDDDDD